MTVKVPSISNVGCIESDEERLVWRSARMSDALDLFWPFLELLLERDRTPVIVTIKVVFPLLSALRRPLAVAKEPNDMSPGF